MNPSDFAVVLVNYKTPEITRICLDLLHEPARRLGFPVWVIDNGSGDASTEYLKSLSWIRFLERTPGEGETGFVSHGLALDMALERADTDFLFLLHTDTFVHDECIFSFMLEKCRGNDVVGVGCLEQIDRGRFRRFWRVAKRFGQYHARRLKRSLGLNSRPPKPWTEQYVKSFCSLWNVRIMKERGWTFAMGGAIPTYALQDLARTAGYQIALIPPQKMFAYLDHIEAGTVAAAGTYGAQHRRTRKYRDLLGKYSIIPRGTKP